MILSKTKTCINNDDCGDCANNDCASDDACNQSCADDHDYCTNHDNTYYYTLQLFYAL